MKVSMVHGHSFRSSFFSLLLFDDPVCCWVMWLYIKCESFSVWTFHVQSSQCFVCVFRSNLSHSFSLARLCSHTPTNTRDCDASVAPSLCCSLVYTEDFYCIYVREYMCFLFDRCCSVLYACVSTSAVVCFRKKRKKQQQQHQQQNSEMLLWNVIFII